MNAMYTAYGTRYVAQSSTYLPLPKRMSLSVKGDGGLDCGEAAEDGQFGVVKQVNLLHGGIG